MSRMTSPTTIALALLFALGLGMSHMLDSTDEPTDAQASAAALQDAIERAHIEARTLRTAAQFCAGLHGPTATAIERTDGSIACAIATPPAAPTHARVATAL